ncbi:MAG TPA: tetratricopeptide repeat protein [Gammaproteobacteria bacterium]|nr:tetratricopeptide repeat protein [Gammaproteobacteria bacterium]
MLGAAALMALMACAWVSTVRADQDDPSLPELFESLKAAVDPAEGERIGRRIAQIWNQHDNPGVGEIMQQGEAFLHQGQLRLALGNFTTVTRLEPGFAEAWNKRASVLYSLGRLDDAARSIAETLAREPRHFLAIAGLGLIYLQKGYLEEALSAFDYALAINPHLAGTRTAAESIRQRLGK